MGCFPWDIVLMHRHFDQWGKMDVLNKFHLFRGRKAFFSLYQATQFFVTMFLFPPSGSCHSMTWPTRYVDWNPFLNDLCFVRKCIHKVTKVEYAVKIISRRIDTSREIQLLKACQGHPNVVQLIDVYEDEVRCPFKCSHSRKDEAIQYLSTSLLTLILSFNFFYTCFNTKSRSFLPIVKSLAIHCCHAAITKVLLLINKVHSKDVVPSF